MAGLARAAAYGGAAAAGSMAALALYRPEKFRALGAWEARTVARLRRRAASFDAQAEVAGLVADTRAGATEAARWQTQAAAGMARAKLYVAADRVRAEAAAAHATALATAQEKLPAQRTEVQVLLPGGDSYVGTAMTPSAAVASLAALAGPTASCTPDGHGTMEFASGDRYKGGFRDGAMHGRGQWEGVTGEVYVGDFAHGRRHGVGSLIGANGDTVKSGRWEDGQFVN